MKLSNFLFAIILLSLINVSFLSSAFASNDNTQGLTQTKNLVKAGNKFVTLLGEQIKVNKQAPDFKVVDGNFAPVNLSDYKNQILLISVVPSLDTGICSLQTKRFNDEVANFPKNITMLTISNDLPFAQKRFCKVEKVDNIKILSDSVWHDFGRKYGLIIKDMGLLTRSIFIIDNQGKIAYKELVANLSSHPNYDQALKALKDIAKVEHALDSANVD